MSDTPQAPSSTADHERYMRLALKEAVIAAAEEEVPVGAVIICQGRLIGKAHNQVERLNDPTAHAEMIAITQAASALTNWRLADTVLYVTKEPCPMCAGAIVLARPDRVVWGVSDPKRGGSTVFGIFRHPGINHHPEIVSGVLEEPCKSVLQDFFRRRRGKDAPDDQA